MITLDASSIQQQYLHHIIVGSIAPRPIAFVSSMDAAGKPNLAPFSFFNAFGVNPATLIFSPARRGRDNTTKHTYQNILELPEVVINVVNYSMVQQVSLASTEYPKGVNEFEKAGFTAIASEKVRPFRVKESPVQYECKVRQVITTGDGPGSANLVICDILLVHVNEDILDEKQEIDPDKIDLVGRMGANYYVRTDAAARFIVPKPVTGTGIGIDALPEKVKHSEFLTGNDLGRLGNLQTFPDEALIQKMKNDASLQALWAHDRLGFFTHIQSLINNSQTNNALAILQAFNQ